MVVQQTYTQDPTRGFRGQVMDAAKEFIDSRIAEGDIGVGVAVVFGTTHDQVELPAATGAFAGVTTHNGTARETSGGVYQYDDEGTVPVLREGRIMVKVNEAVTAGDSVFYIHTGGDEGEFRQDVDTANATAVPNAVFETDAALDGLAIIFIPAAIE